MAKIAMIMCIVLTASLAATIVTLSRRIEELDEKQAAVIARLGEHLGERDKDIDRQYDAVSRACEALSRDSVARDDRIQFIARECEKMKLYVYKYLPWEDESDA